VSSTLEIFDVYSITDFNIEIDINHTKDADLTVTLISPLGTEVVLFSGVGGGQDNFTNTVFYDGASTPIASGSAPFTGTFLPQGNLSNFETEMVNGTWTLEVYDAKKANVGTLNWWSLTISE